MENKIRRLGNSASLMATPSPASSWNQSDLITRRRALEGLAGMAASSLFTGRGFASIATNFPAPSSPQPTPPGQLTKASVNVAATPNGSIGPAFVGLCYEKTQIILNQIFRPSNKNLIALLNLIGPSVLRIGGDSPDKSVWTPHGKAGVYKQVTPAAVDGLAAFLKASGWQCLYCINLAYSASGQTTPEVAADEVAYVAHKLGPLLYGIEIGNEPDAYARGPGPGYSHGGAYYGKQWDLPTFEAVWNQYRDAIVARTPGVLIAGPAAGHYADWTVPFSKDQTRSKLGLLTGHMYYGHAMDPTVHFTAEKLISPERGLYRNLKLLSDGYQVTGIPYRIAECNSYTGLLPGVCDAYASTLWSLGFLLDCAQGGAVGTNFTSGGNAPGSYTPLADDKTDITEVRPEFYGLLFFTLAGQGTLYQTRVAAGDLNVIAATVKTSTGTNVVILNKDLTQNLQVAVQLPQNVNAANLIAMTQLSEGATGPNLAATSGVTIQGSAVGIDGKFSPGAPYSVATRGSSITCYVPALSAVLIRTT